MPTNDDIESLLKVVESSRAKRGEFVTDEERSECYHWLDGQEISPVVDSPGFELIMAKLNRYMDEAITVLVSTSPVDKEAVFAHHAEAHAAASVFERLKNDIKRDIDAAQTPPDIIKEGLRLTRGIPAESV